MKRVQSNKIFMVIVSVLLVASLILPTGLTNTTVQAAAKKTTKAVAKPSISATAKIGTGSFIGNCDYFSKTEDKYFISVSNPVKKATYSFTSSNNKILTVKASGLNAYLTGIAAGTATITCYQKLNKKTTKVGTCKVTVVNATYKQDYVPELPLGTGIVQLIEYYNRNNSAVYTYVSDNKNFSMKETFTTFDGKTFVHQNYTAKAPGTYNVTIKETYNKKTRVVAKIKYIVKKATVEPKATVYLGQPLDAYELINNYRTDVNYVFESEDTNVFQMSQDGGIEIIGQNEGTTKLNIYENTKVVDKAKLLGTCEITVKEIVLKDLECDFEDTEAYVDDYPVEVEVSKDPSDALGAITATSSNPEVATVSNVDEDGYFEITPVKAGTTTITITCGKITKTQTFTVIDEDDEDYDDDYDEDDDY